METQWLLPDVVKRFMDKVEKTLSCWMWKAGRNGAGYGVFTAMSYDFPHTYAKYGRKVLAHRFLYELTNGPNSIPQGMVLANQCGNRACVKPAHWKPLPVLEAQVYLREHPPH